MWLREYCSTWWTCRNLGCSAHDQMTRVRLAMVEECLSYDAAKVPRRNFCGSDIIITGDHLAAVSLLHKKNVYVFLLASNGVLGSWAVLAARFALIHFYRLLRLVT